MILKHPMNRLGIYKALRRHRKLAAERALDASRNKTAKAIGYVLGSLVLVYLMGFAIMFSLIANESETITPIGLILSLFPFVMVVDFSVRLSTQQTPSQLIKPYVLLPLPRYACVESFIISSLLSWGNLIWMALFVPFCIMSVVFSYGIGVAAGFLCLVWLLILLNSQIYLICRTLINDSMLWWILPLAIYGAIFSPWYIGSDVSFDRLVCFWSWPAQFVERGNPLPILAVLAALTGVMAINRRVQYAHVMAELSRVETTKIKRISSFSFFERYGEVGNYLQLELKQILRNKNPRKQFISAAVMVLLFSLLITFSDIYDGEFMTAFLGFYNFVVFGAVNLTQLLSVEGNYIDCLMVRRENILKLLTAKYIFYCGVLVLPFVLMLPTVFSGKWSVWMLITYALFTAGPQYCLLFQTAVYNKRSVPLNTKFISRSNMETNWTQLIIQMTVLFCPMIVINVLAAFMPQWGLNLTLSAIGLAFVAFHRAWLHNVYRRLMARHYENFEGFRASR